MGKIPENIFQNLLPDYSKEQAELDERLHKLWKQLDDATCTEKGVSDWLSLIAQYMEVKELDRAAVMELIESITIHETVQSNGKRVQEVSIPYRFIGNLLANAKEDVA